MHASAARLVDIESENVPDLREALADAGCIDIDSDLDAGLILLGAGDAMSPGLVIVGVHHGDVTKLERLATGCRAPVLAVCDEIDVELALSAGAAHCATRPLRKRELVGRIRDALRPRDASTVSARERKLSETIVALRQEKQDLERLVCVDALTGIANRRHTMDLLGAEWKRAERDHSSLAVIMIDLDCYHAYNEQYGHLGGDACLQRVADAMVRCLRRPSDVLGRYGGEEFIAVLPNTDAVGAKIVAERLRAAVEALAIPHAASVCAHVVTTTVGFAAFRVLPDDTMDRLIAAADAALLQAKSQGRNRVGGIAPLVRPSRVSAQRWTRYAPVYVDPWFADRVPSFLSAVRDQVEQLVESARHGERRSGVPLRRLREVADELGLVAIDVLLRDVETAVREGELPLLRVASEELLQYVAHVQVIYRRSPAEPASRAVVA